MHHRDIVCSPKGLVVIVCPVEKYAKEFKLISSKSLDFYDEFDIGCRAYGVQFPPKASPVEENCKDAHIQLWEAGKVKCLCNDGHTVNGSRNEEKCSPDETCETVQSYCYPIVSVFKRSLHWWVSSLWVIGSDQMQFWFATPHFYCLLESFRDVRYAQVREELSDEDKRG